MGSWEWIECGVGVYLSPFKDVGGPRIIFADPSNVFSCANKDQQRESNHAVYAFDTREKMIEANDNMHKKEIRFDLLKR